MTIVDLSIIIVNWNSKDYLRGCLQSIRANPPAIDHEIIVVDSASYDGVREMIAIDFPGVRFIQSDYNLGFAKANNLAAKLANGNSLLLLNPDTLVHGSVVDQVLGAMRASQSFGVAGCTLLNSDGSYQTTSTMSYPTIFNRALASDYLGAGGRGAKACGAKGEWRGSEHLMEVEAVSGAALFIKKSTFDLVGGFTETYFMYSEDVDLCYKVAQTGLKIGYLSGPEITHFGGGSSSKAVSHFAILNLCKSWAHFLKLRRGRLSADLFRIVMALNALLRILVIIVISPFVAKLARTRKSSVGKWSTVFWWAVGLR